MCRWASDEMARLYQVPSHPREESGANGMLDMVFRHGIHLSGNMRMIIVIRISYNVKEKLVRHMQVIPGSLRGADTHPTASLFLSR